MTQVQLTEDEIRKLPELDNWASRRCSTTYMQLSEWNRKLALLEVVEGVIETENDYCQN